MLSEEADHSCTKFHKCVKCGTNWSVDWYSLHVDKCPACRTEMEPDDFMDFSQLLMQDELLYRMG